MWDKKKKHFEWLLWHWSSLGQVNLEKVPTDLVKISVKEATHMGFYYMVPFMGPFARYVKLRVVHAPGMPGTFSSSPWVSDPAMHHGMCVTHVPSCKPRSLISGFIWRLWRGKRSRHSQRMRDAQFYVSGKRPIATLAWWKCKGSKKGVLVIITMQHKPLECCPRYRIFFYGNPHVTVEYNDCVLLWVVRSAKIK